MDSQQDRHHQATVSPLPASADTRELYIGIASPIPDNGLQQQQQPPVYVEVLPNHTLADVRTLILECLDEDLLPSDRDFYFCVCGIRVSKKQEARKPIWALAVPAPLHHVTAIAKVSIHSRLPQEQPQKRPRTGHENVNDQATADVLRPNKQARTTTVMTTQDELVDEDEPLEARRLHLDTPKQTDGVAVGVATSESGLLNKTQCASPEKGDTGSIASDDTKEDDDETVEQFHCDGGDEGFDSDHLYHAADSLPDIDATSEHNEPLHAKTACVFVDATHDTNDQALDNMESDQRDATDLDDDDGDQTVVIEEQDTHLVHKQALEQSTSVLREIEILLKENPFFCSEERRLEWVAEITQTLTLTAPDTIVGVLGNTGVGKSSLLNALLDEASVLPTSGSRGCTATVVELRFNKALQTNMSPSTSVPVYKGEVEFITLLEWRTELKLLMEECCTNDEKKVYIVEPQAARQPDAAAAWSKIDQVYGGGTMIGYKGRHMEYVLDRLSNDRRVVSLLTPEQGSDKPYNAVVVAEGEVTPDKAAILLKGFVKTDARLRRDKKKWAQAFRSKINDYVYRKGNGDQPQTWPLIRRVLLEGPWSVLSSGACLVDLPGVRDANVARAKVSEQYLQNCSEIWVVAPIKRAVDDGTAKELLGEQFKRRLLMDGQYGNVKFICTQTDDCEATEIMRDHKDVAMEEPGRWETMTALRDELADIEKRQSDLAQEREDLQLLREQAFQELKDAKAELRNLKSKKDVDLEAKKKNSSAALKHLHSWDSKNKEKMDEMKEQIRIRQRRLKALCATVRNEYSKACLQADFRAGLKELCRKDDDVGAQEEDNTPEIPLPKDFEMDVFCISANDYLKISGIKPPSDGLPNTFSDARDTQIPDLRANVHVTTAHHRTKFTETFVSSVGDMVDRVKLLAADASNVPGGPTARLCQSIFEKEMEKLAKNVKLAADNFCQQARQKVNTSLHPSLKIGAEQGRNNAMSVVESWGSTSRRNRHDRSPGQNGLHYGTYFATVRRDGCYVSPSAGPVDFNQELCDPMEKEFGANWQQTMDAAFRSFLDELENKVGALCVEVDKALVSGFRSTGMDLGRLQAIANTASRTCGTFVKTDFEIIRRHATDTQRDLNRSLLPLVQARMKAGYGGAMCVQGGPGIFMRMKAAVAGHSRGAVMSMFDESTIQLLKAIDQLVTTLGAMATAVSKRITSALSGVYSVCWEEHTSRTLVDPAMHAKIRACRDKLLPDLNRLFDKQKGVMDLVGLNGRISNLT